MPSYFVVGATGRQGGATAFQLLAKGHEVRAIVRDATSESSRQLISQGAKLYHGQYHDAQLLTTALKNTVGIFLNPYIDMNDVSAQSTLSRTIIEAACATGTVKHIVVATAFLTGRYDEFVARDEDFPLRWYYDEKVKIESIVKGSAARGGYTWTILRPSFLFYDYLPPSNMIHFPELYTDHELAHVYQPEVRMPHLSEEDVGKFAVAAFDEPQRLAGESIELGAENLTVDDVGKALSEVSGVQVKTRLRGLEEAEMTKGKVATQGFHDLANWTDISISRDAVEKYGLSLATFREYLEREKEQFIRAFGA